eukprot:scaffold62721_cov23-Cyclotella_meneghiniana.AAC.1
MSGLADIHVGQPNDDWPVEEGRVQVHFHNFADLPQQKGEWIRSSKFTCAGHEWCLWIYPRGRRNAADGMVSGFLTTYLASKIVVDFDIIMKNKTGDNFRVKSETKMKFPRPNSAGLWRMNYASRSEILDTSNNVLNNGTLTFEVRIRPENCYCLDVTPESSVADDVYNHLYQDEDTADVAFEVKGEVFYAHKAILKARVPELLVMAEPFGVENPMPINDVDPELFETMLKHIYGKKIRASYWEGHAKQILDASEKYGFTELKSAAEAWHVKILQKKFTVDNVVDELLYADGKNFPLLKRSAMAFIVKHGEGVIESASYEKLDESPKLRREVMKACFASNNKRKRDEY